MSWWSTPDIGDHVRAERDITSGWLGGAVVRKGRRGIVRAVSRGVWRTTYVVEFDDTFGSLTVTGIEQSALRASGGHGESSWAFRRDMRRGVRLGMFLAFTLPALLGAGWYLLNGGTLDGLLAAAVQQLVALLVHVAPVLVGIGILVMLWRSRRGRNY